MANETEPAKFLLPYLQRADELQKHEPLVAYYCRLYAMEKGLGFPPNERTKTTNSLLVSLMNQLEKDKKSLKLGPEDNLHLEGFALNVFAKADKQDRAGRADLNTAKTFYAASVFFEILNQFGALQPDLEQKQKYAAWKAADIRKALKEGRKPIPGPPGGSEDLSTPPIMPSGSYDFQTRETTATGPTSDSGPSPQFPDNHYSVNAPPLPQFHKQDFQTRETTATGPTSDSGPSPQFPDNHYSINALPPPQFHDNVNNQHSADIPPSPPSRDFHPPPPLTRSESSTYSNPTAGYPSHDYHPPPPVNRSDSSQFSQSYHHQSYQQEPQQHLSHNYPSYETPSFNYPNFQSYPSFTESSLPSVLSHHPSYYQSSETSYSPHSAPPTTSYPSTSQYTSSSRNGAISEPAAPAAAEKYHYDSNYQPPPEKIAEAHKAARFAVGALAFDDVSVAVEHLKKSLELLTNPSAGH
ncbi:protein HOMOLOG OF MAMMALIAN LYST-INTERACTING PROTEIN 5-like [Mangifera indica]|uniref:protein HOMOLOG OF MAMMALIAN LYST-INTERACTING PROTEIN 5-like n=1 Tax=Mangifera indica TaxID=29780 RepID=UPI001CF93208|nr:protein HOMOLOG OF MAMMALIAN LYST-INTERACTING PROTEIN 5-like [Mangifera indica]